MKLPAIQFYPGDWRKDVGVQSLSYHDRGVWFEILMLMHESSNRGRLMLGNKPIDDEVLAVILRIDIDSLRATIATLIERGVTERDRKGVLINRRMVRDEISRSEARGKMSSWRKSKKQKSNCNDFVTDNVTGLLPLSSSSSSSSSSIQKLSENDLEEVYEAYPVHKAREKALTAIQKAAAKVAKKDDTSLREALAKLKSRVEIYARLEKNRGTDQQYIPQPASWFNAGRYNDDELVAQPGEQQRVTYRDPASLYESSDYTTERRPA